MFAHAWTDDQLVTAVTLAAAGFCLVAAGTYAFNDIVDREADAREIRTRFRPVASGAVTVRTAAIFATVMLLGGLAVASLASPTVLLLLFLYALLNVAYSLYLKRIVLVDVFIIATGFMIRILAGTTGVGIPPSQWLVLCGMMIALFLGFAKRRAALSAVADDEAPDSRAFNGYSPVLVDKMIVVTASGAITTYSLYTMSPDAVRIHHTSGLIYTVPIVMFGIFRYMYLLHEKGRGGDTARDITRDPAMVATMVIWLIAVLWVIK